MSMPSQLGMLRATQRTITIGTEKAAAEDAADMGVRDGVIAGSSREHHAKDNGKAQGDEGIVHQAV
jgi:hypothetical protein